MDRLLIGSSAQKNAGAISAPAMRVQRNEILFACMVQQAEKQCMNKFACKTRLPSEAKTHIDLAGFIYELKRLRKKT
jgi:hypothetical protein